MEPTKPRKLTHALRNEPVEDFGGTPTKGEKTAGIGIVVLAVMWLILTSAGRGFHMLKTAFVLNRIQAFCDAVMIGARNDDYGSGRSFVSWGSGGDILAYTSACVMRLDFSAVRTLPLWV